MSSTWHNTGHTECHQNHPAVTDLKHAGQTDSQTNLTVTLYLIPAHFVNSTQPYVVSGFLHSVNEILTLLGCYAAQIDVQLAMFQDNLQIPSSRDRINGLSRNIANYRLSLNIANYRLTRNIANYRLSQNIANYRLSRNIAN